MTYYHVLDTDFTTNKQYKVAESGSFIGAQMRALAEIWRWVHLSGEDISEIVQYTHADGTTRIVPKTDGCFWDHGIVISVE